MKKRCCSKVRLNEQFHSSDCVAPCVTVTWRLYHMLCGRSKVETEVYVCRERQQVMFSRCRPAPRPRWGCRLITAGQSAMLPQCPTRLVAQSAWLICTTVAQHAGLARVYRNLSRHRLEAPRVVLSQQSLTLFIFLLPFLHPLSLSPQRTYLSYMGKTRRTLLSMACLPLPGTYLCRLRKFFQCLCKFSKATFTTKYILNTFCQLHFSSVFWVVLNVP